MQYAVTVRTDDSNLIDRHFMLLAFGSRHWFKVMNDAEILSGGTVK
jgi:hypothetical protein